MASSHFRGCIERPARGFLFFASADDLIVARWFILVPILAAMKKRESQILKILAEATREAYDEGWRDAITAITAKTTELQAPTREGSNGAAPKIARKRGRPPKSSEAVLAFIKAHPGQNGVDVAKGLPKIPERTVRTCLRRLRLAESIHKENEGWFAK